MTRRTIPAVFAGLLAAAVLVLSGCSTATLDDDYSGPSDQEIAQESAEIEQEQEAEQYDYEPVPDWEEQQRQYNDGFDQQQGGGDFEDRCEYDPTYNNDWHDDMVCDGERLYLLPDDNFVDQAELEQAARKWIANQ